MNKKIIELQAKVKANKNLYNSFGGFSYRSAEGILESVKPLLTELGLTLTLSEDLTQVGGELAVKSIAVLSDGNSTTAVTAWAVVDLNKKGMDKAQATGAATSYARKYALCGLLLLDDGQDNDAQFSESNIKDSLKKAESLDELKKMWEKLNKPQKDKIKPAFLARYNELNNPKK